MSYDICFFMPSFAGGGAEKVIIDIANHLAARGRSVALACAKAEGPERVYVRKDVDVIDFGKTHPSLTLLPLRKFLKKSKPKVFISSQQSVNVIAVLAGRWLSRYPGRFYIQETERLVPPPEDDFLFHVMGYLYKRADGIIALSETLKQELAPICKGSDIQVILNPLHLEEIARLAQEEPDHPWLVHKQTPVLLAVGRLSPEKGFDTLLHAFSIALQYRPLKLIILGEGELRPQLERLAKKLNIVKFVSFAGYHTNPYAQMAHADLFVLSSSREAFALPLAEAMACGTRLVATECCTEILEMLGHGDYGTPVPPDSPALLADAILKRLDMDPVPPETLREQVQRYDIDVITDAYEKLLA